MMDDPKPSWIRGDYKLAPGIYPGLDMASYLAIDALSTTPVRYLVEQCDRAGWWHSRLNPQRPREVSEVMDIGTIAHSVLLEDSWDCVAEIDPMHFPAKNGNIPKGWTNDAIREARDSARAAGKCPILTDEIQPIRDMVTVAQEFIASLQTTEPAVWRAFDVDGGQSEVTMVWEDDGLLCKLRVDRISDDYGVVIDYKTSGQSVEPERFARTALSGQGYNFGAAWYRRGIHALTGVTPAYLFLAQEVDAPHLCSLTGLDPTWIAMGDERVAYGLKRWRQCVASGQWIGYPNRVVYPELKAWQLAEWEGAQQGGGYPYDYADLTGREKPEFLK